MIARIKSIAWARFGAGGVEVYGNAGLSRVCEPDDSGGARPCNHACLAEKGAHVLPLCVRVSSASLSSGVTRGSVAGAKKEEGGES